MDISVIITTGKNICNNKIKHMTVWATIYRSTVIEPFNKAFKKYRLYPKVNKISKQSEICCITQLTYSRVFICGMKPVGTPKQSKQSKQSKLSILSLLRNPPPFYANYANGGGITV
jgi:hypothetical protein